MTLTKAHDYQSAVHAALYVDFDVRPAAASDIVMSPIWATLSLRGLRHRRDETAVARDLLVCAVAAKFCDIVRRDLPDHMPTIIERNLSNDRNVCASHDFCDANMLMEEAFTAAFGRLPRVDDAKDAGIWSEAWGVAKGCQFRSLTAEGWTDYLDQETAKGETP